MSTPASAADSADKAAAARVLNSLQPMVDDYLSDRSLPYDSLPLTLHLSATAHGIASLLISTTQFPSDHGPSLAKRTVCAALHGFHTAEDAPTARQAIAAP